MKIHAWISICIVFLLFAAPSEAQNRVLDLDGNGSYVELPSNIFNDLTEATVEGWVKWRAFRGESRCFDFGKEWQSINAGAPTLGVPEGTLRLQIHTSEGGQRIQNDAIVPKAIRAN